MQNEYRCFTGLPLLIFQECEIVQIDEVRILIIANMI